MLQKGRTKVEWARWRHILYGFNTGPYNSDMTPLAQCASFATACVSRFDYEKSGELCFFWSDKLICNFSVFNNTKITLHYSVYMRKSIEKVRKSDEAEHVQSVS